MRFIFVYTPFYTNADWILLMRRMKIMKILDFYWSSKCWEKDDLILQYYDSSKSNGKGLNEEIPMPIVLKIKKTDNVLIFEQTEYTNKYLSKS